MRVLLDATGCKLSLLVCTDPLDPGTRKRSDRFDVEI